MRTIKSLSLAAFAAALTVSSLHADAWDKKTIITINAPMQIPTMTLQPGTYTLKLLDSLSNRHIVTVWDQHGMSLVTTVLAIPNYRLQPTGKSQFTFWETPSDQPPALRAWFYPGDNFGQEFAYPKWQTKEFAMVTNTQVPTLSSRDEGAFGLHEPETTEEPATVTAAPEPVPPPAVEPTPEPAVVTPDPAPPVAVEPEPAPAAPVEPTPDPAPPAAEQQPATIPQTATRWTEIWLVGLIAAITGLSTFVRRRA